MKDFYDIYYLSHTFNFDGRILQEAIMQTLTNRGTPSDQNSLDRIAALAEDSEMHTKWRYFLRTINGVELAFPDVIEDMDRFLRPVWNAIIGKYRLQEIWDTATGQWK